MRETFIHAPPSHFPGLRPTYSCNWLSLIASNLEAARIRGPQRLKAQGMGINAIEIKPNVEVAQLTPSRSYTVDCVSFCHGHFQ